MVHLQEPHCYNNPSYIGTRSDHTPSEKHTSRENDTPYPQRSLINFRSQVTQPLTGCKVPPSIFSGASLKSREKLSCRYRPILYGANLFVPYYTLELSSTFRAAHEFSCPKFFAGQLALENIKQTDQHWIWTQKQLPFTRVWMQGIVSYISEEEGQFTLDDGTGVVVVFSENVKGIEDLSICEGSYLMVIGAFGTYKKKQPCIFAHKIVDLSDNPSAEPMWYLEIIDIHKRAQIPLGSISSRVLARCMYRYKESSRTWGIYLGYANVIFPPMEIHGDDKLVRGRVRVSPSPFSTTTQGIESRERMTSSDLALRVYVLRNPIPSVVPSSDYYIFIVVKPQAHHHHRARPRPTKGLFYNGWKNLGRKQDHITMSGKRKASSDKSVAPSKALKPEVVIPGIEEDFEDPIAALADFGDDLEGDGSDSDDDGMLDNDSEDEEKEQKPKTPVIKAGKILRPEDAVKQLRELTESEQLFQSNLFKLQLDELFKEIKVNYARTTALESALKSLKKALTSMKEYKVDSLKDLPHITLHNDLKSLDYTFNAPQKVQVGGSFMLRTNVKPALNVDLVLEMPDASLRKKDINNYRYHDKRNLFLAVVAHKLNSMESYTGTIEWTSLRGDVTKPILSIHPKKDSELGVRTNFIIRLHPSFSKETKMPRHHLSADYNHRRHITSQVVMEDLKPTPYYNRSVIEDSLVMEHLEKIGSYVGGNHPGLSDASILLKLWARQRGYSEDNSCISGFVLTMILIHLVEKRVIMPSMSSYQALRVFFSYIAEKMDVSQGIFFDPSTVTPKSKEAFLSHFPVVVVDHSGMMNLTYNMSLSSWKQLKSDAALTSLLLHDNTSDAFELLFLRKSDRLSRYDLQLRIQKVPDILYGKKLHSFNFSDEKYKPNTLCSTDPEVHHSVHSDIELTLTRALKERATLVKSIVEGEISWKYGEVCPPMKSELVFGINLDFHKSRVLTDFGPSPEFEEESRAFKEFWGSKVQVRRFPDGSILNAVVWSSSTIHRPEVVSMLSRYILNHRHKVRSDDVQIIYNQLDHILSVPDVPPADQSTLQIAQVYSELSRNIFSVNDELPLKIERLSPSHPVLRYTDPFPPHGISAGFTPVVPVAVTFNSTKNWPKGNIKAIEAIKLAFYSDLVKKLTESKHIGCGIMRQWNGRTRVPHPFYQIPLSSLDVTSSGITFRLFIVHRPELTIIEEMSGGGDFAEYIETEATVKPELHSIVHDVATRFGSFGGGVRLAQRWMDSHLFSSQFPVEFAEILMAHIYTKSSIYNVPNTPISSFFRFLSVLSDFDFESTPIVVDAQKRLTVEQHTQAKNQIEMIRSGIEGKYQVFLVTPKSVLGSPIFKFRPGRAALHLAQTSAKRTLELIERACESSQSTEEDWNRLFVPATHAFDLLIELDSSLIYNSHLTVGASHKPSGEKNNKTDNVSLYLSSLEAAFDNVATFYADRRGSHTIGVQWKSRSFNLEPFKVDTAADHLTITEIEAPKGKKVAREMVPDVLLMITKMKQLGEKFVKKITLVNSSESIE
ncbi:nucleolar protein 6-like protein [Planoprotostelium fungivorum]|uniref:Nucleolar protein 6-like protein n=1 Tax=Planoprotostelium fungivorum TaxID=1890364 RepID=A0A2P6N6C1_9EUKA|nr:nucleolar protein 6-like protein [Planoprotostelium fungivorum]